jgi:hypothetical protein
MTLKALILVTGLFSLAFGQIEETTQTIPPEGGTITLETCGYAEFPEGYLIEEAEISFSCSDNEATSYPANFGEVVAGAELIALGHNTLITIPAAAIDRTATNLENTKVLKVACTSYHYV